MAYDDQDLLFSPSGDLIIQDGDLCVATSEETMKQDILNRIKTNNPEWYLFGNLGANLEDLKGEPNTIETGIKGEGYIIKALTSDERINSSHLKIDAVPTSINVISYFIEIDIPYENKIELKYDLELE